MKTLIGILYSIEVSNTATVTKLQTLLEFGHKGRLLSLWWVEIKHPNKQIIKIFRYYGTPPHLGCLGIKRDLVKKAEDYLTSLGGEKTYTEKDFGQ